MRISDIAHFTHSKNLDNMMDKIHQPLISCENYLSSWKCATIPELFKVCNANGKLKILQNCSKLNEGFQMGTHPNARVWESVSLS